MDLNSVKESIDRILKEHPELGKLEVYQTSCFDDPLRFSTSGIFAGDVFKIEKDGEVIEALKDEMEAQNRRDKGCKIIYEKVIIIEAY